MSQPLDTRLAALGLAVPELLLPKPGTDLKKWAVIACDQFIQDGAYWEKAAAFAGDAPSSLNLIYPEAYLEKPDRVQRIAAIHRAMERYLSDGTFTVLRAPVYVERDTPFHRGRRGLVAALDLERYDWKPGGASLVRPTEDTVAERLPPRMEIRRNAPLETPHILVLIDDEENAVLPALAEQVKGREPLYDTELMLDSGRVRGWALDEARVEPLVSVFEKYARRQAEKYGALSGAPFLYAVGDGNHSLAAAKAVWEEAPRREDHPARRALVEIENLYDPALTFEPIHRILFGVSAEAVLRLLAGLPGCSCRPVSAGALAAQVGEQCARLRFGVAGGPEAFLAEADPVPLAVDVLQPLLDRFMAEHPAAGIDYIHGEDEVFRLAGAGAVGILLPPFRKQGLFETIARRGPLPRKSFSMGEAREKRFYLECRRL